MTPKRFVSWAAVSSLPQAKKISLEDQLAANREHVQRHGGMVVEELVVPGESRDIVLFEDAARRMTAYARLHELIQAKAFDVLIYLDRSRLGRQAVLSMAVVALCRKSGIAVYEVESPPASLEEAAHQTHSDMLIGAIKSVDAENEISKLKERHRKGMIGRIRSGRMANKVVYGYLAQYDTAGEKQIVIDEPAAAVVRRVFAMYLNGKGARLIAARLNAEGIPAPLGGKWLQVSVRNVIDGARRYAGYTEINKRSRSGRPYVQARGNWQPIIDDDTLARIEAERQYRNENRRRVGTPYRLTGVVCCKVCGKRLIVQNHKPRKPHYRPQMRLLCPGHANIDYWFVLAWLRSKMAALQDADLGSLLAVAADPLGALRGRQSRLEGQLADLDAALARADAAYVRGRMTLERYEVQVGQINDDIAAVRRELEQTTRQFAHEAEQGSRRQRLEEAAALGTAKLDDTDETASNAWLRAHVRLYVERNKIYAIDWL
jgi:DNA invertase Pin-like site-specific DNA recombinase